MFSPASSSRHAQRACGAILIVLVYQPLVTADAEERESGIQVTSDQKRILVNKDVGAARYAITQDRDDGSASGNVFFTDDRPPTFLYCAAEGGLTFSCSGADACPGDGRQSGIQRRPDGKGVLVSKDVDGARFAISQSSGDGTLTGNVFFADGRSPVFLYCDPKGGSTYSCFGSDRCEGDFCPPYAFIADVTLPADFLTVPAGCPDYTPIGHVTLPENFFTPIVRVNASSAEIFGALTKVQSTLGVEASLERGVAPITRTGAPQTIAGVEARFEGSDVAKLIIPSPTAKAAAGSAMEVSAQGTGGDALIVAAARADGSLMEGFYELPLSGAPTEQVDLTFAAVTQIPLVRLATRIGGVVSEYEPLLVSFAFSADTPLLGFMVTAHYPLETGAFIGSADSVSCRIPALGIGVATSEDDFCRDDDPVALIANNRIKIGELVLIVAPCVSTIEDPLPLPLEVVCGFAAAPGQTLAPSEDIAVTVDEVVTLDGVTGDPGDLGVTTGLAVRQ
jgi:hypothetical protein